MPGRVSTPLETSTPQGAQRRTASTTLCGVSPPAGMAGRTLQPLLAEAAIRELARSLARAKAELHSLLREVDSVRAFIGAWRSAPSPTSDAGTVAPPTPVADESASMQEALASDVTVFAREQLRFLPTNPSPEDPPL